MYSIYSCPEGRLLTEESVERTACAGLLLHLRENRSDLSQEARTTFTTIIVLFMAAAILPVLKGNHLVPLFSIGTMALLVTAITFHTRSLPAAEWLLIERDRLRHRIAGRATLELPARWTTVVEDAQTPAGFRLMLQGPCETVEIGRCLALEEKRALASLIARQLSQAGGRNS